MRIRRLPRAIRDVDDIWTAVAGDDRGAANRLVQRIARATDRLADYPESAPLRPDADEGLRSLVVGRYLVLYRVGRTAWTSCAWSTARGNWAAS